jgi:hypothetical protein
MKKAEIYRKLNYCNNCPFKDEGKAIYLDEGRMDDIRKGLDEGGSFNCHKTAYSLDDNMQPLAENVSLKMCYGAFKYLKEKGEPNQVMQVALRMGVEDGL